ncbi:MULTISPECIES: hypothetical protein [unclassified Bradyrhizobium]|uniref:hypothetical protein n=1 Tax=unclassified Bradyrhizobium TaxID=2631580 RepID=UPI001FF95B24|nr:MULTISPECIES: hypothetical protein [unclassified Bradyrhizobium]MCK1347301.1 hypothetical protein [Bradyrhizobium sp. CW11]MCK1704694.1 hypothetical protein [Bradyrhizobium sp. 146]
MRPLTDVEWLADIADLRERFTGMRNFYRSMAHHSNLLRAWTPLRQHVAADVEDPGRTKVHFGAKRPSALIRYVALPKAAE